MVEESPYLINGQPDIRQPKARNRPAQEIISRNPRHQRIVTHEIVFPPQRNPGQDEEKDPQFQTKYNIDDGQQSAHVGSGEPQGFIMKAYESFC